MVKQTKSTRIRGEVKYINPNELPKNPAFTNVVTVTGSVKTVYVGGQDAVDASGAIVGKGDLKAQTEQILKISRQRCLLVVLNRNTWSSGTFMLSRVNPYRKVLRPSKVSGATVLIPLLSQ